MENPALWFSHLFCLCEVSENNVMLSFNLLAVLSLSSVMILLPFLSCFLFKDQIASFQLKEIVVFLN